SEADFARRTACENRSPSCSTFPSNTQQSVPGSNKDQQQLGTVPLSVAPPDLDIPNYPTGNIPVVTPPAAPPPTRLVNLNDNSLNNQSADETNQLGPLGLSQGLATPARNTNRNGFSLLSDNGDVGNRDLGLDGLGGSLGLDDEEPRSGMGSSRGGLGTPSS